MQPETQVLVLVFIGVFGCLVGSFLNVCIFRLPRECMSIVRPGSRCPNCLKPIRWFDNIPILSYLVLGAKCRNCRTPISIRYPLIELLTGALFFYAGWTYVHHASGSIADRELFWLVLRLYLISVFLVVTFIDLEFRIIPDEITYSGVVIALVVSGVFPFLHQGNWPVRGMSLEPHLMGALSGLLGAAVGSGMIYLVGVMGKLVFRKDAMGFGDVKYMAMMGGFFGWKWVLVVFILACFLGAVLGIIALVITKDRTIAFGPYLSGAALLVLLFRSQIHDLIQRYREMTHLLM